MMYENQNCLFEYVFIIVDMLVDFSLDLTKTSYRVHVRLNIETT